MILNKWGFYMYASKQITFEKIQQKITFCIKEAHQELEQVVKTGKPYVRLYEKLREIEKFLCLLALYIEMEPGMARDLVSWTMESVGNEMRMESGELIK